MAFVLDASVALSWAFGDEEHPHALAALDRLRGEGAVVPSLWWFEVRNILIVGERKGRILERDSATFLQSVGRLPIAVDDSPDEAGVLGLARRHRLAVYDAAYLELALRLAAPLATLDGALAAAAKAENLPLIGSPPPGA